MPALPVLAVDNSEDDLALLRLAFRKAAPSVELRTLETGEEAIDYIAGIGQYADRQVHPIPRLILVDLKMPRVDGYDVLREIRARHPSASLFVVMLSSSKLAEDIEKAKLLGATAFHTKPIHFNDLCIMVQNLSQFFSSEQSATSEKI